MEDSEEVKATEAHSPTRTVQLSEEKHAPDPAVPEVEDANGISPKEEAAERLSVAGVELRRPEPAECEEAVVSEPDRVSYEKDDGVLTLKPSVAGIQHNDHVLSEGEKSKRAALLPENKEVSFVPAEDEAEHLLPSANETLVGQSESDPQPSLLSTSPCHALVSEGDRVHLSKAFIAEVKCYVGAVQAEHCPSQSPESLKASNSVLLVDIAETITSDGMGAPVAEHEGVVTNRLVGPDDGTGNEEADPTPASAHGSDEVAGCEIEIAGVKVDAAVDGAVGEEVSGYEIEIAGGELDTVRDGAVLQDFARNEIELAKGEAEAACERAMVEEVTGYEIEMTGGEVEDAHDGDKDKEVDPVSSSANGSGEVSGYDIEQPKDGVEPVGDELAESVESAGEDAETVGSGNIVAEDDFGAAVDVKRRGGRRRKRGRPPSKVQGTRFPGRRKEDEEVCFICFDGGDLVVCDRRGCPKVYHPSCVNRDESYFRSKGQWSCGWHICSECQKSSSYMCYTCTYSLCKVCFNVAGFTCIREKKGFCETCMRTVLLIETSEDAKEKKVGVDFNDRSTWEYLFKDYWLDLKGKLSLTLEELTRATTASKVNSLDVVNEDSSDDGQESRSDRSSGCREESNFSKKKLKKLAKRNNSEVVTKAVCIERMPPIECMASKRRMKKHSKNTIQDSLMNEEITELSKGHQENSLLLKAKKRYRKTANEEGTSNNSDNEVSLCRDETSRKKVKRRSKGSANENLLRDVDTELRTVSDGPDWASKELLEFVSCMKNGDKTILPQYDVQQLLLHYIKVNKLRDPRKRSQIICDAMLYALFGKLRVGHFEMLKLLESHFFVKVSSPASDENQGDVADTDSFHVGTEGSNDVASKLVRRTTCKRMENEPQTNVYDYASINVHNINLMYLRRCLMEDLIDDMSTFSEKVIGSFVRIRVSASSQRQEVYRLVQVVGCGKAPERYKTGKRMTDVMLEIINLDKKEVITIDIISNQEFTEEECKRLRQSIKFGFISRLTVGEVQEKARVLQAVRVSDFLESEKLRLTHLRDRASEKGKKKDHRECVEKLQILSTPEEHMRRLNEVPEVHTDPKMDPNYESPEDEGDQDEIKEDNSGRHLISIIKEKESTSPGKEGSFNWSGVQKNSNNVSELGRTRPRDGSQSMEMHSGVSARAIEFPFQEKDERKNNVETGIIEANTSPIQACLFNSNETVRESTVQREPQLESLPGAVQQSDASGTEKLWHYKDPSGKIQGPFTMVQLRKWSKHFPSNLRIWRKSERQEDSILLNDALAGNFQKDLPEWVPGHINTTQITKINDATTIASSVGCIALSSPSFSVISSIKLHETGTSLPIYTQQNKDSNSDTPPIPTGQSSLGSLFVHQNTQPQNDKAIGNAASSDIIANLEKNCSLESALKNLTTVNSESTQHASSHLTDMHNQLAVLPYEIDPRKRRAQEPGTSTPGNNTLSINGDNQQPRTDVTQNVLALGHVPQKQDISSLNYGICSSHGLGMATDKKDDHSTSSTESNTVPEMPTCDPSHARFQNGRASDVKPNVQSNTMESVSPQRSDASTFLKSGSDTQQSAYVNSLKQNSCTSVVTSVHSINACEHNLSQNGQPNHLEQQTVGTCNWNFPTDTKREQSVPSQNSSTMLCGVSNGIGSTSVNCQSTQLVSPDCSQPFASPQFNNNTSVPPFQPSNINLGTGTNEVNNPGWQGPAQYQNFSNVAAAVGNLIQGGFGNPNLAWGMMAQGNMNMPWGVVPPNVSVAWGSGITLPPQASANFVWGAPQGNAMLNEGCRPPLSGNAAPYPFWGSPAPGNSNQNPGWPAPVVGNTIQNAWAAPNQGNTSVNNTSGIVQENKVSRWDSAARDPSGSGMQNVQFRDRDPGSRDGGFRGNRPGYGSGRPSRNWMTSGNTEGSPRLSREPRGICRFFEDGYCRKGASCNYIHSGPMER